MGRDARRWKSLFLLGATGTFAAAVRALTLDECVAAALDRSPALVAADAVRAAAEARADSLRAQGVPKLSLDAQWRHLAVVPAFKPSPFAPAVEMGDNTNYSFGPQALWSVWDSGQRRRAAAGLSHQAAARAAERDALENELRWSVRRAYFQAMGAAERIRSVAEVLRLAEAQREDIRLRRDAGAASRQDWLQSEAEALGRRREFNEAQADLAAALRALFLLTRSPAPDLRRPLPRDVAERRPSDVPAATFVFESDDPAALRARLADAARRPFNTDAPDLRAADLAARAAREAAASVRAGRGPSVQLLARASRDYPNGPVKESIRQNTLGATARWSIFEGGRSLRDAAEQDALAAAAAARLDQTGEDRRFAWAQARERLASLSEEEDIQRRLVDRRREIAEVVYDSYKAGRASYLEVESANTTFLNARVQSARLTVEILTQLAWIDRWSAPEVP